MTKKSPKIAGICIYPATVLRLKMLGATGKSRGKRISYDVVINELIDHYENQDKVVFNRGKKLLKGVEDDTIWIE